MQKTCIIIAGPTAAGKTAAAIELARHFSTEIISFDSRQCYRELNIGVAKPEPDELAAVRHHFINSHSIHESLTASDFEKYALESSERIFKKKDILVLVGGTGLYLQAFAYGLDPLPPADPDYRIQLEAGYKEGGLEWLQQQVRQKDPEFEEKGEFLNPRRLMRALEVFHATGQSILSLHAGIQAERNFRIIPLMVNRPREILYERINLRVDAMMQRGLEKEAFDLLPYRALPALQTVGYRELFSFFDADVSREQAVELIRRNTRHYAKRQLTWFRNRGHFHEWNPQEGSAIGWIEEKLRQNG